MRILVQFIGQAAGIIILHRKKPAGFFPFKMWFYPLPAVIAIIMWLGLFFSTGKYLAISGLIVIAIGVGVYFIWAYYKKEWPFK
jgi:hypothetical protein